ncbi:hypothetical protein PseudUWO311_21080 [Pseudanabaena sp. UWO311]|nr:hypothetical protein PseudUWO311_21080 [Pseudanabaena sp. UWO311]
MEKFMLIRPLLQLTSTIVLFSISTFAAQAINPNFKNTTQLTPQGVVAQVDVRPTDYWFSAVQSLTERYGISMFYSDGTFRGTRQISQNELLSYVQQGFQVIQRINPSISQPAYAASMRGVLDACKSRYGNALTRGAFAVCFNDALSGQVSQSSSNTCNTAVGYWWWDARRFPVSIYDNGRILADDPASGGRISANWTCVDPSAGLVKIVWSTGITDLMKVVDQNRMRGDNGVNGVNAVRRDVGL